MKFEEQAGKQLAEIARLDGCDVQEAFQRAMSLYKTVQIGVWQRGFALGVIDSEGEVLGIVAANAEEPFDPNSDIEL